MGKVSFECGHCREVFETPADLKSHFEAHEAAGDLNNGPMVGAISWDRISPTARIERLERRMAEIEQFLELGSTEH
jgi:hypothetical protein